MKEFDEWVRRFPYATLNGIRAIQLDVLEANEPLRSTIAVPMFILKEAWRKGQEQGESQAKQTIEELRAVLLDVLEVENEINLPALAYVLTQHGAPTDKREAILRAITILTSVRGGAKKRNMPAIAHMLTHYGVPTNLSTKE